MVTGKQPSPTEEARWDLRSSLGQRHRRKRRSRKVPVSCDRFCLPFKSSFSFVSIRIDSALLLNGDPQMSVTHTLITTYRCLWSVRLLHVHHLEHAASGAGKKERLGSHTWAFHASTQRWHRRQHPQFIGQNESLRARNTTIWWVLQFIRILQWNSWEQCCQFFLTLEKLLRYSFVQKLKVIWPSPSGVWNYFLSDSSGWYVSDSSSTSSSLCRVGLIRFVSPLSPPSFPPVVINYSLCSHF